MQHRDHLTNDELVYIAAHDFVFDYSNWREEIFHESILVVVLAH
jgi:hypothetical protein